MRGDGLDLRQGPLQRAGFGQRGRVIGMDGHRAQQPGLGLHGLEREARGLQIAADLDGARDADRLGGVHRLPDRDRHESVAKVQMGVVVHHWDRQRLRGRRIAEHDAGRRPRWGCAPADVWAAVLSAV